MRITEQERAALQRVETDVLPVLMAITDEQLEDRAVAMDTKQKVQAAQLDIAPAFQVRTRPQRPFEEPEVADGEVFRRATSV